MNQRHPSSRMHLRRLQLRPIAFSLICAGVAPAMAQVLPTGFMPIAGGVTMTQGGGVMNINQPFQRGIVNWQTFSIGAGGTVNIAQPSTRAVLLNRVVGDGNSILASRIDGTLRTSLAGNPNLPGGSVFLVNPSGIVFGRGASVNVGGLVASTLDIANDNFMPAGSMDKVFGKNEPLLFVGDSGSVAQVKVEGGATIATTSPNGTVALLGGSVRNEGDINVARGSVGLMSASKVTLNLDFDGDGLTTFKIPADGQTTFKLAELQAVDKTATAQLMNSGSVAADGGRVVLMAAAADVDARQLVVSQTGVVRARSLASRNGEIVLDTGASPRNSSEMLLGGTLDASGGEAGAAGGSITARGDYIRMAGLNADASGASGGSVSVRGVAAASMAPDAKVSANATGATGANGAGGTVSIEASELHVSGEISARGAGSGAGGTIDTTGDALQVSALARIDAAGGATGANGKWNATARGTMNVDEAVPAYDANGYGGFDGTHVSAKAVGDTLGRATDVVLSTASGESSSYDVVFQDNVQVLKSEGRDARLTVDSLHDVRMNSGASIASTSGALHVDFDANASNNELGGGIQLNGASIASNGGDIRFYGQGNADTGYATGAVASLDGSPYSGQAGITVSDSTLSTCATGAGGCGGAGSIVLRGQGVSQETGEGPDYRISSDGVAVLGSTLATGAGSIGIDGKGGIRANGVYLGSSESNDTVLRTGTGDVSIVGSSRSWTTDDPVAVYASRIETSSLGAPDVTSANTAGVSMSAVTISAGGRVGIDGTGSDTQGLLASTAFVTSAAAANNGTGMGFGAGDGVSINGSSISAGQGRDVSIAGTAGGKSYVVNNGGTVLLGGDANAVDIQVELGQGVRAEGGRVAIDGRGGDVRVVRVNSRADGPDLVGLAPGASDAVLDVSSTAGAGGTVSITGRNVLVSDVYADLPTIDAGGAGQSGTIDVRASNAIAIDADASLRADAKSATGNGGTINVIAGDTLRGYGSLSARGGSAGGNGGSIETSAPHFALLGLRVDASAPVGTAGSWLIDPFNVNIAHGVASGSLTGNPFDPLANSTIQDGDINNALDGGTSVTITTGTGGVATDGNITFAADAAIVRSKGSAPLTFELDAAHNISAVSNNSIQSNAGALNVVLNAGVGGQNGSIFLSGAKINTNGGDVTMTADTSPTGNQAISITNTTIDTRTTALGDAGPGGAVQITGKRGTPTFSGFTATVQLNGATIQSSTGDVSIAGTAPGGTGVRIGAGTGASQILTTSGDINITGIGSGVTDPSTGPIAVQGVDLSNVTLRSVDGDIAIRGLVTPGVASAASGGVLIANNALVTTLGVGSIDIAGESQANGTGVTIATGGRVDGNNNVVLRAGNDGTTDALAIAGNVRAGNVLNLRPGGVDAAGNAVDRTANPITLGGTAATGFAVSAAEFAQLDAPTIVAGSNAHAGAIDVVGPLTLPGALTLQNGGGGGIQLGGAVTVAKLGLVSGGDITQTAAAPITAGTLLARSTGGSVLLDQAANNVSAATVGGGAAGAFRYVDVDTVQLGSVSVTGYDAAGNAPQAVSATSMAADTVFVRTLSGDLLLGTNVSSTNGVDLVAGARFQNLGGYAISGAPWRVWADTWVGETRGGLAGSGLYPNLYHCAYSGLCTVGIPAGANHFIYAQQPVATVRIGNATRPIGFPNPLFSYTLDGLILGDTGAGFAGFMFSPALRTSPVGVYPINGSFTSAEGYAVNVVPGNLLVAGLPDLPRPDTLRDLPVTWLYDRNIGPPPICFATGSLEGDRAVQGADVLAREWSRVRSRPNLSSCVDTEKRNGCADF